MRIYRNCKEAASETKRELKEMGVEVYLKTMQDKNVENDPDYVTHELMCYSYMIVDTSDWRDLLVSFGKNTEENFRWLEEEFNDRISRTGVNPGNAWRHREEIWKEFMHDGKFSYTYSERIGDQVHKVIEMLKVNPTSRNAIISIWDRELDQDRIGGKQRVPCTMFYQVLIRDNKANMIYNIRSNDLMTHWCYDIALAVRLQEYIASMLNMEVGNFYQFVGSLHGYAKDLKGIF